MTKGLPAFTLGVYPRIFHMRLSIKPKRHHVQRSAGVRFKVGQLSEIVRRLGRSGFETVLAQAVLEGDRITPIKTGFAEMIFRVFDVGCAQKTLEAQVV